MLTIFWTEEALENLEDILSYLHDHWTQREVNQFTNLLFERIELIALNPYLFPKSSDFGNLRKSVLTPQTSIIYWLKPLHQPVELHILSVLYNRTKG